MHRLIPVFNHMLISGMFRSFVLLFVTLLGWTFYPQTHLVFMGPAIM